MPEQDGYIKDVLAKHMTGLMHNLLRQARNMRREPWWFSIPTNEFKTQSGQVEGEIIGKHVPGFDT